MNCSRCQSVGTVRTSKSTRKRGLSGGKIILAFFTAGISILFVGLSRKEPVTILKCSSCGISEAVDR